MTDDPDDLRTAAAVRQAFGSITLDRTAEEVTARTPRYAGAINPSRPRRGPTVLGLAAGIALLAAAATIALVVARQDDSGRRAVGSGPDRGSPARPCADRTRSRDPGARLRYLPSRIPRRYEPKVSALNLSDMCERVEAVVVTTSGGRIANSIRVVSTNRFTTYWGAARQRFRVPGFRSAIAYPGAYPSLQLEARGPDGTVRLAIDGDGAVNTTDLIAVARAVYVGPDRVTVDPARLPPPYFVAGTRQPGQPPGGVTWRLIREGVGENGDAFDLAVDTSYPGDPALLTDALPRDRTTQVLTIRGHRGVFRPASAENAQSELEWFEAPGVHITVSATNANLTTMTAIADSVRLVPIDDPRLPPTA